MPRTSRTIGKCHLLNLDYAKNLGDNYKKYLNMSCYEAGLLIARDARDTCIPSIMATDNDSMCHFAYTLLKHWIDTSTKEMRKIIKTQIYNNNINDPRVIEEARRTGQTVKNVVTKKADVIWKREYEQQIVQSKINKINGIIYRLRINPEMPWNYWKDESNLLTSQSQLTYTDRVQKIDLLLDELSKMDKKHTIRRNWRKVWQDQKLLIKFNEEIEKAKNLEQIQKAIMNARRAGISDIRINNKPSLYDIARKKEQKILEQYKDPIFVRNMNLKEIARNKNILRER
jgi:hypothetical protein